MAAGQRDETPRGGTPGAGRGRIERPPRPGVVPASGPPSDHSNAARLKDTRPPSRAERRVVLVPVDSAVLDGELTVPAGARGAVLFAHGSDSSRHSPRNRYVARVLQEGGFATLLIDLLTPNEEALDQRTHHLRFDVGLLADRLVAATDWFQALVATGDLRIGYFGASTGAAAALVATTERPLAVSAVVSRGGRPDLAGQALTRVAAPTLLIVGANDLTVVELNRIALKHLKDVKRMEIVPGASHLFEEPGALERVAELARVWFDRYLAPAKIPLPLEEERGSVGPS